MKNRFLILLLAILACVSREPIQQDSGDAQQIVEASPDAHHAIMGYGSRQVIVFTASSTVWVAPAGISRIHACGCGGGGSGGAGGGGNAGGGPGGGAGGGGGAWWICMTASVTPGTSYTVTAGAGGAGPAGTTSSGAAGGIGTDSVVKLTSGGLIVVDFPGASGGSGGGTPAAAGFPPFGGMPWASGPFNTTPLTLRSINIFDLGRINVAGVLTDGAQQPPQAGGKGTTSVGVGVNGSSGVASLAAIVLGTQSGIWAGGAGGTGSTISGAGAGGGAGPLGAGAGGANPPAATTNNGLPGNAAGANTCAGGGGGSGGGSGATTSGGAGGAGGTGEVIVEF